jgi:carboxymethylenebutenolidase
VPDITLTGPEGDLRAYLARPEGEGAWPGVVVIHDIAGMSTDLRGQADWLAGAGYLALAPDLFSHGRRLLCVAATMRDLQAGHGRAFRDLDAARRRLVDEEGCTGRIGVIGFCMGGGFALLLAPGGGYGAASVNYGRLPKDVGAALRGSCPVVGSYGGRDRTLRGAAERLDSALAALGVDHDVSEYPQAGHSFLNRHDSVLLAVAGRLMGGGGYEPTAAQDARRRILAFFDRHLRTPAAAAPAPEG